MLLSKEKTMEKKKYKTTKRTEDEKREIISRLNRMRGQLDGIIKMVEQDRYCNDILIQLSALSSASRALTSIMLENHLKTCVRKDFEGSKAEVVDEIVELFKRV